MIDRPPHPYATLPSRAIWRKAVAEVSPFEIGGLWEPKFAIRPDRPVATAGSCFAQHIGRALRGRGYAWTDGEPAPPGMSAALAERFGYGLFSFKTGNIYTSALLRQWVDWALGAAEPSDEVWEAGGRVFDPFRPTIHPGGFRSAADLLASRATTLRAMRRAIETSNVFVFTLGLTESWSHARTGVSYPMCPGTAAGAFDPGHHVFRNLGFEAVRDDMAAVIEALRRANPALKILLTVSPVPLTATASGAHVLVASTHSKSTLRAAAGELAAAYAHVDYFPSYEIVTAFPFRGMFFGPNLRSVTPAGVAFVMDAFFGAQEQAFGAPARPSVTAVPPWARPLRDARDAACDEELLDAGA